MKRLKKARKPCLKCGKPTQAASGICGPACFATYAKAYRTHVDAYAHKHAVTIAVHRAVKYG